MEISKKSLWYRLALYGVGFNKSKLKDNLCPFMRHVAFGIFFTAILWPIAGAFGVLIAITPFVQLATSLYFGDWMYMYLTHPLMIISMTAYGLVLLIGAMMVHEYIKETEWYTKRQEAKDQPASPLIEYIRAVKNKMCPHVDYVE